MSCMHFIAGQNPVLSAIVLALVLYMNCSAIQYKINTNY